MSKVDVVGRLVFHNGLMTDPLVYFFPLFMTTVMAVALTISSIMLFQTLGEMREMTALSAIVFSSSIESISNV